MGDLFRPGEPAWCPPPFDTPYDLSTGPGQTDVASAYGIPGLTSSTDASALLPLMAGSPWPSAFTPEWPVGVNGAVGLSDPLAPGLAHFGHDLITGLPDSQGLGALASPPALRSGLVVIDDAAAGLDGLATALESSGYDVMRVGEVRDPLAAVQLYLEQHPNSGPLHLFGHGSPGRFLLGRAVISSHSIPYQQERWAAIGAQLADGVSIRLYGCDVGATAAGERLLHRLHELSGQPVQASDDLTYQRPGAQDWELEVADGTVVSGEYEAQLARAWGALQWQGELSAPTASALSASFDGSSGVLEINQPAGSQPQVGDTLSLLSWSALPSSITAVRGLALGQGLWIEPTIDGSGVTGVVRRLPGLDLLAGIDSESARAQFDQLLAGWLQLAGSSISAPSLTTDLSLDLGPVVLGGRGTMRLDTSGNSRELVLELSGGSLDLTGLGLGRISDVNGSLRWGGPNADPTVAITARSGFNSGDVQLGGTLELRRDSSTGQQWQLSGSSR